MEVFIGYASMSDGTEDMTNNLKEDLLTKEYKVTMEFSPESNNQVIAYQPFVRSVYERILRKEEIELV